MGSSKELKQYQIQINDGVAPDLWYTFLADDRRDSESELELFYEGEQIVLLPKRYIVALISEPHVKSG